MIRLARIAVICGLVLAVGCGGDDDDEGSDGPASPPAAQSETAPAAPTETTSTEERTETARTPEADEGGAGDEEPIRSEAVFTGRDGRITPRRIEVPPYIAIEVVLEAKDDREYELRFENGSIGVADGPGRGSINLDGIPPDERHVATGTGGVRVEIVPLAEPGP